MKRLSLLFLLVSATLCRAQDLQLNKNDQPLPTASLLRIREDGTREVAYKGNVQSWGPYFKYFLAAVCPADYDLTGNLIGDKTATVIFDCTKLKCAVPGFQCTTRFDEGVRRCIDYVLAHPELQVEDPEFDEWCDRVVSVQEKAKTALVPLCPSMPTPRVGSRPSMPTPRVGL